MAAEKGPLLRLEVESSPGSGTFDLLAGIQAKSLSINNSPIDVTTDDDVNAAGVSFRTFLAGVVQLSVSGNGFSKEPTADFRLLNDSLTGTVRNYRVIRAGFWSVTGPMFVGSYESGGSFDGAITFSISLSNNAAMTAAQI